MYANTTRPQINIHYRKEKMEFSQGDIVMADFGSNGTEEKRGYRPAMIVSAFMINKFSSQVIVVPLTSLKPGKKILGSHLHLTKENYPEIMMESLIQFENIRSISKSLISKKIFRLHDCDMKMAEEKLNLVLWN